MNDGAPRILLLLGMVLYLGACSDEHRLVANGFSETAEISALDNQGFGNFALPILPKGCLLAFRAMPDISTTQIRVYVESGVDKTYDSKDLAAALKNEDVSKGVFVVDNAGLRFEKGYECDSERQ